MPSSCLLFLPPFADIIKIELSFLESSTRNVSGPLCNYVTKAQLCLLILFCNRELHSPRPVRLERLTSIERTVQYTDFAEGKEKSRALLSANENHTMHLIYFLEK